MKNPCFFLLLVFISMGSGAQDYTSADGLRWVNATNFYNFLPLFQPDNNKPKYIAREYVSTRPDDMRMSPDLKYTVGNYRKNGYVPDHISRRAKKFLLIYSGPGTKGYAQEYPDKYYALAVLDDGRILSTDPTLTKSSSIFDNLYLADPQTGIRQPVYTGRVWEQKNAYGKRLQSVVSGDNTQIALLAADGFLLVDVLQGTVKKLPLPPAAEGTKFPTADRFFFAEDNRLLCVSGSVTLGSGDGFRSQHCLSAVDISTGKYTVRNYPEKNHPYGSIRFLGLHNNAFMFDVKRMQLQRLCFADSAAADFPPVTLDTASLPMGDLASYHPQLMETPEGLLMAFMPDYLLERTEAWMYMMNTTDGRLHRRQLFFEDPYIKNKQAEANAAKQKQLAAAECTKMQQKISTYSGVAFSGINGPMYVLGYDCNQQAMIVAHLEKTQVYGASGKAQYMPHSYIVPSYISEQQLTAMPKIVNAKRICPACHGYPAGTDYVKNSGWTWKRVLGIYWGIQSTDTKVEMRYTLCNVCKGAAVVARQ